MEMIKYLEEMRHKFVKNRRAKEGRILLNLLRNSIKKDALILDVGCGIGENLTLLRNEGYKNVVGTDVSREMLDIARKAGHNCIPPGELRCLEGYDVMLFSHILEHIEYRDIQNFLEGYFALSKPDSYVIICMPILYDAFYNDIDHIKPYYPKGLCAMFSNILMSKQYTSKFNLKIIDLHYLRSSLVPYNLRSRHIRTTYNYVSLTLITFFFFILKIITLGLATKVVSYVAIFKLSRKKELI